MLRCTRLMICVAAALCGATPLANAFTVDDVVNALRTVGAYSADARFVVSMPQLSDDVVYAFTLRQSYQPGDTLLGADYLLDWHSTAGTPALMEGFVAYCTGGDHYRYNGQRLQEYHSSADPQAFDGTKGVHRTAQFVDILPVSIAAQIEKMIADSAYTITLSADTLVGGRRVDAIRGVLRYSGVVAQESEYLFDRESHLPLRIRQENSPGSISEQSLTVEYGHADTTSLQPLTELSLMEIYPDVFANLRQSNFRIQSLPGTRLPGFSLPTPTRERYSRGVNDAFRSPTIVALLNNGDAMTSQVIRELREAADEAPVAVDILWVFAERDAESAEQAIGSLREGEHLLISGRSLMRDCGAADLPAVLVCDTEAFVKNVIVGYNQDMRFDVIQMIALL